MNEIPERIAARKKDELQQREALRPGEMQFTERVFLRLIDDMPRGNLSRTIVVMAPAASTSLVEEIERRGDTAIALPLRPGLPAVTDAQSTGDVNSHAAKEGVSMAELKAVSADAIGMETLLTNCAPGNRVGVVNEVLRAVRPGGRAVFLEYDWESCAGAALHPGRDRDPAAFVHADRTWKDISPRTSEIIDRIRDLAGRLQGEGGAAGAFGTQDYSAVVEAAYLNRACVKIERFGRQEGDYAPELMRMLETLRAKAQWKDPSVLPEVDTLSHLVLAHPVPFTPPDIITLSIINGRDEAPVYGLEGMPGVIDFRTERGLYVFLFTKRGRVCIGNAGDEHRRVRLRYGLAFDEVQGGGNLDFKRHTLGKHSGCYPHISEEDAQEVLRRSKRFEGWKTSTF
jgi:hypothetical protein